jgi:hypothetical protein
VKPICFSVFLIFIGSINVFSQNNYSVFFFPGNPQSGASNPAKLYGKGRYYGVPLFSSLSLNLYSSNISYNDFIAKDPSRNDSLMIKKESLGKMGPDNKLFVEIRKPLLVYGWGSEKNAFEVQLGINGYAKLDFSKNLASLLLEGNEQFINKTVDFNTEKIELNAYSELSMGYARKISEVFYIGVRLKTLWGITNTHTKSLDFSMLTDNEIFKTNIYSDIILQTAGIGNIFKNKGLATDFGMIYRIPAKGIELTASVLDFGFIHWKDKVTTFNSSTKGKIFEFKGITGLYSQSIQEITDSLKNQMEVTSTSGGSYTAFLPVKYVITASYCPHQNGEIGVMYLRNFGTSSTSLVYTMPMNSWLRLSVSNTSHKGRFVNLGFGFEFNWRSMQCFGAFEDIDSFWLNRTKNMNLNLGMNIFLSRGKTEPKNSGIK